MAALALRDTLAGAHLDVALSRQLSAAATDSSPADSAAADVTPADSARAIRDMCYGAMRTMGMLRFLATGLNARRPAPLLAALQMAALAQLLDGRRPAAIVIDQAVSAATRLPENLGSRASAGFINATLRRFARERDILLARARQDPQATFNHPAWWIEAVRQAWPACWQEILGRSLEHAPLVLRVNRRQAQASVDPVTAFGLRLAAAGLPNRRVGDEALALQSAVDVHDIPGFIEGACTVQDAGAQLAAPLLQPRAGETILDACAAPGGKTTHLLQLADSRVLAIELDAKRAGRIAENLRRERLPLHAQWPVSSWGAVVRTADAARPDTWWDGQGFDKILLDAPCSASGTVRRHPDIPWHRRRSDIATLAAQQQALLQALWPLLRPGGTLLYVTCSVFPEEGEAVIAAFCSPQRDCARQSVSASWPDGQHVLSQLLPTRTDTREHDGFFYALLSKRP